MFDSILNLLKDPPPEYAFEISAKGIAVSRTRPPAAVQFAALADGVLTPSPVRENIVNIPAFTEAVRRLVPPSGKRTAALILPDNAMRLSVLEFESLPEKEEERMALVRFRLKKTVPFDVDTASVSFHVQTGNKVVVAVTPAEVVDQYEAPFRSLGLQPGLVTPAALAVLELLPAAGSYLAVHQNSGAVSVLVIGNGVLTLARSLELSGEGNSLDEIVSDLYATRVFVEDQTGVRPDRLYLAGFGATGAVAGALDASQVASRLTSELDVEVEIVPEVHAGLAGYLRSISPAARKVAA
jgi:type IV pilus assembly protein PilM